MAGSIFVRPKAAPISSSGAPYAGAKYYFYATGTSTLQSVYTDSALTTPHANPVVADGTGTFAPIWLDPTKTYRAKLTTAAGVLLEDVDPVDTKAPSASNVTFLQSGTGAVTRYAQDKMREVVSVKDFGAKGDGTTDDTAAFVAAFAASNFVYVPASSVSYRISTLSIASNKQVLTDGFSTVIHQTAGVAAGTRMLVVAGSNVVIGSMKVKGNIASDTGEQNHSIFIYSSAAAGSLSNIVIGDISGEDVRGDVLYIGAATSYNTKYIKFGQIIGKNILRNVVSIVGGSYITGDAAITDTSTGYATLDIEPDTVSSTDIYVGYIRGGVLQCAPPLAANTARRIHFNRVELNPSYQANSTPAYSGYAAEIVNAVWLRNTIDFRIDHLDINGHTGLGIQYIYSGGEQRGEGISIGYLRSQNVGSGESTYNAVIQAGGINSITINDGNVALQAVGDQIIIGDSSGSTFTRAIIDRMVVDGRVARYVQQGRFSNIFINTTNATQAFVNVDDSTILDSDITVPTLISFSSRNVFVNVKASCSTAYYGSTVVDTTRINCNWGSVATGLVTQRAAAAALTGEIAYGSTTATTVGAAGGASALPATPTGYIVVNVSGTDRKIPYYAT